MTRPSKISYSIPTVPDLGVKPKLKLDFFQNSLVASGPMTSKPNRTYRQSAVIPYRKENDRIEIILITSRSSKRWIFPKGIIEPIMTPEASTAKEALEEAGVIGHASSTLISEYEYEKWAGFCNVQVYALEVTQLLSEWDEMDFRKRMVVEISEAIELIKKNQRPSLERLRELLSS